MSVEESDLPFAPSEDPFVIEHGGFYRRWMSMIEDLDELRTAVDRLTGTTDDVWVPVWRSSADTTRMRAIA